QPRVPHRPAFVGTASAMSFPIKGGHLWIDPGAWKQHAAAIVSRAGGLLKDERGGPAVTVTPEALLAKDSELVACEVECRRDGIEGGVVEHDVPGLDAAAGVR